MLSSDKSNVQKILMESAREVSRDADVAEQIYKAAKARGIEIIPHGPTPMTELEKNLIASRSDLMFLGPLPCLAPCCRGRLGNGETSISLNPGTDRVAQSSEALGRCVEDTDCH